MRKDIESVVDKCIDAFTDGINVRNVSSVSNYELALRLKNMPGFRGSGRIKDVLYNLNVENRAGSHRVVNMAVNDDSGSVKVLFDDLVFVDLYDNAIPSFCDLNRVRPVFELQYHDKPMPSRYEYSYLLCATAYYFNKFEDRCFVEHYHQINWDKPTMTKSQRDRIIAECRRQLIKTALGDLFTKIANKK